MYLLLPVLETTTFIHSFRQFELHFYLMTKNNVTSLLGVKIQSLKVNFQTDGGTLRWVSQ